MAAAVARGLRSRAVMRAIGWLAILVLGACSSGDSLADGALGGDVVGTWRALPNATDPGEPPPAAERPSLAFDADGTLTVRGVDGDSSGTYQLDDGHVVYVRGGAAVRFPYRATAERFVFEAMTPVGTAFGPAGTWHSIVVDGATPRIVDVELRDGGAAVYDASIGGPGRFTGTWRADGDDIELVLATTAPGAPRVQRWTLVAGVLGVAFERVP